MKITKLRIQNYKNIQDLTINFADGLNYAAFVGLNGSGKSNIIEAVSLIFMYSFQDKKIRQMLTNFKFEIETNQNQNNIKINVSGDEENTLRREIKNTLNKRIETEVHEFINSYLPTNIIACYSGEETRLYDGMYKQSFQNYFSQIKRTTQKPDYPKMVYLDKSCWEICAIAMLCSEKQSVQEFTKKIFGALDLTKIGISFSADLPKQTNSAVSFVNKLYIEQNHQTDQKYVSISYIQSTESDGVKLSPKDIFYFLFMSYVPKEIDGARKLIKDLELHGIDIKSLSEGEKKQMLITFINEILADENSLVLLDEPDAHWHIERQKELANTIKSQKHFTVLTTHSPTLTHFLGDASIYMLNNDNVNVELINHQNRSVINELSGGLLSVQEQNILLASNKHILLVEGKTDVDYIQKAISVLNIVLEFEFIPCGGASGIKLFIDKFTPKRSQKIIVILDCDDGLSQVEPTLELKEGSLTSIVKYSKFRDNVYLLPLPKPSHISDSNYMIEDYFPIEKKTRIATELISKMKTTRNFKIDYKKIKKKIHEDYINYSVEDFKEFEKLFDIIKEIINLNAVKLENINNTSTQLNTQENPAEDSNIKIFNTYNGNKYEAYFNKNTKKVTYDGVEYDTANKAMFFVRHGKSGVQAGKFWKYQDNDGGIKHLDNLPDFKKRTAK